MNIREVFFTKLTTDPVVGPLIKDGTTYKLSPAPISEEFTPPYIVYQEVSSPVSDVPQTEIPRYQFRIYDDSSNDVVTLSNAVKNALRSLTGDYSGISVGYAQKENEFDLYDDTVRLHSRILEYRVLHTQ